MCEYFDQLISSLSYHLGDCGVSVEERCTDPADGLENGLDRMKLLVNLHTHAINTTK